MSAKRSANVWDLGGKVEKGGMLPAGITQAGSCGWADF